MDVTSELLTLKELHCDICENFLTAPIFLSQQGKNACGRCCLEQAKKEICIRNAALERVIECLEIPCRYSREGCSDKFHQEQLVKHEEICKFKPVACPLAPCGWSGSFKKLKKHLISVHQECVISSNNLTFDLVVSIEKPNTFTSLLLWNSVLFLLHVDVLTDSFKLSVSHTSDDFDEELMYMLKIDNFNGLYLKSQTAEKIQPFNSNSKSIETKTSEFKKLGLFLLNVKTKIYSGDVPLKADRRMKILECPVCLEITSSNIFACLNGHNICLKCKNKVTECPSCRGKIQNTRILCLEALYDATIMSCPNESLGCAFVALGTKMRAHYPNCKFEKVKCLFEKNGCTFIGLYYDLVDHLKEIHHVASTEFTTEYQDEKTPMEDFIPDGTWLKKPLVAFNHIFLIRYYTADDLSNLNLDVEPLAFINNFVAEVSFGNKNTRHIACFNINPSNEVIVKVPLKNFSACQKKLFAVKIIKKSSNSE